MRLHWELSQSWLGCEKGCQTDTKNRVRWDPVPREGYRSHLVLLNLLQVLLGNDPLDGEIDSSLRRESLDPTLNISQVPIAALGPLLEHLHHTFPLGCVPWLRLLQIHKLAHVELPGIPLESATLSDDTNLARLDLLHIVEALLLLHLPLHRLDHLQLTKLIIAFNRFDDHKAPLLELFLRLEGHFDNVLIRCGDLDEIVTIVAPSSIHCRFAKISKPSRTHLSCVVKVDESQIEEQKS